MASGNASDSNLILLVNYSMVTILVFILTSKVFSPQYIIWILPLVPLAISKWRNILWLLFMMIGLMTAFIYPKYYAGIVHGELITVGMLFLRNLALIVLTVLAAWSLNEKRFIAPPRTNPVRE